jgi:hypothetical protein
LRRVEVAFLASRGIVNVFLDIHYFPIAQVARVSSMLDNQAEAMEGLEVTNPENHNPARMTDEERRILDVYDRLEELQFEIALLKAQGVLSQGESLRTSNVTCSYKIR